VIITDKQLLKMYKTHKKY